MSDILIKNMELPKEGLDFIAIDPNGHVYYPIFKDSGKRDTEAIALPDHGDLIDKDSLKESMRTRFRTGSEIGYMQLVDEQKVILPKSGS